MPIDLSRRSFLKSAAVALGCAALGAAGLAFHEAHRFTIQRLSLRLPHLPPSLEGFRIAQLSDLHFGEYLHEPYFRAVVEAINRERVDLALLTGDFITYGTFLVAPSRKAVKQIWPCAQVLSGLRTRHGCIAVLGNHDVAGSAVEVTSALSANGCAVLRNDALPIESGSGRFWIAGLDDVVEGSPDLDRALRAVPWNECVVVAVHEPDYADIVALRAVDLQLSGHSHGGQIRLPFIGAPVLPYGATKYPMGHYRIGEMQLYTNRGIGVVEVPVRLLCAPEITILELHRA